MVTVQTSSGKETRVEMAYDELRALWEQALSAGKLLELRRPDGGTMLINPANIDYVLPAEE